MKTVNHLQMLRDAFQEFVPEGRILSFTEIDGNRSYAVICGKHPEAGMIPVQVSLTDMMDDWYHKFIEAFDSCLDCQKLELRKAAKLFRLDAARSKWPEGAEL